MEGDQEVKEQEEIESKENLEVEKMMRMKKR